MSVARRGRKWRVRWREWVEVDGERVRRSRQESVSTEAAAVELRASILRALEAGRRWEPEAEVVAQVVSVDTLGLEWLRWHARMRGTKLATVKKYGIDVESFLEVARHVRRLDRDAPVPASLLSRQLFVDAAAELAAPSRGRTVRRQRKREGELVLVDVPARAMAPTTVHARLRAARDVWQWAAGDPAAYPGVPVVPPGLLPRMPAAVAPPAPTLAELDAAIRHVGERASTALVAAILMRYTGLRVSQVMQLREVDLDRRELTLTVRGALGKSRRESSRNRVLPIPRSLLEDLAPHLPGGEHLVPGNRKTSPAATLRRAWERATEAGEVRREVWEPEGRHRARPDHAFRAGLQAHLDAAGVRESAIDELVGHAPTSTRRRHYAPVGLDELRRAVELLPPIDWRRDLGDVIELRR